MRKSTALIFLLSIAAYPLFAQRELSNPLINSADMLTKGIELHNAGKYKEAINVYLKVSPSDTSYSTVLHEIILSYYADSNYVKAEKYCDTAMAMFPHEKLKWYGFLADIYDDTKRTDLALTYYDSILAQNPYNYLVWFNKGITLYRQEKYDDAIPYFQHCVMLNPYYSSAHYYLGQLALRKGNLVQAVLSFSTNLLAAPGNRFQQKSVSFLQTIAEVNTTTTEYLQKYKPGKEDDFEDVQEILASKASLDKKYKLKADLEDQIVRQLQVVMEKLEFKQNDKGFWMQYYVPMYKNIWDNDLFEPLIFKMFSELDIKKVKEYNNKEKKKIERLTGAATDYLNDIRESQEINFTKRKTAIPRYYVKNYLITGKGTYGTNAKNETVVTGPWEFYFENGNVKSKGVFDKEGNRIGDWRFYYENGVLKELSVYDNDLANGKSESWNDNGLQSATGSYKTDELDGLQTSWFYSGRLSSEINFKAGKKEGPAKYYSLDGFLNTTTAYKNNMQEGEQVFYYANGKKQSVSNYVADVSNGDFTEYYEDGALKTKGAFVEGKKTGTWKSFYEEGKPASEENYVKGELDGASVYYFENGQKSSTQTYKKGQIDDVKQDFDEDGILFCEAVYERGRLRDIKFLDKKGTVISQTTSRKGNGNIAFYSAEGIKESEGYYSKEGLAEGEFNYYYKSGKVSSKLFYKNGLKEGKSTNYFANGKISEEGNYKADLADGYFVNYYQNSQVSSEGWYVDGDRQGTFIYYDLWGNINSKFYYLDDKVHGVSQYYRPGTKADFTQYYDFGWFNKIEQYDSSSKTLASSVLKSGEGKVRFNHFNGKPYFESNYKYYQLNGSYIVSNGDGSRTSESYYKNGDLDSTYIAWHPNGKTQVEGRYENGKKTGVWKYYYYNGKLFETENYKDDELTGKDIQYDHQGGLGKEYNYKKGNLDGEVKYYGDNTQLMIIFYYKNDVLLGYSYEDKTGKPVPMISLPKEAGTVDAFYRNGAKSAHIVFNEGLADGDRIFYFSNGKEQLVGKRSNGRDDGNTKTYYPSGKLMTDENYYYGERHGSFKYYNEDGTLISDLNYYLGKLHGDCKYYIAGKPTTTYNYYYGLLESKK